MLPCSENMWMIMKSDNDDDDDDEEDDDDDGKTRDETLRKSKGL